MRRTAFSLILCILIPIASASGQESLVILGATVVDVNGGAPIRDAAVVIENGRFTSVGPESSANIPGQATVIRADGMWLVPGLMNMHVHFGLVLPGAAGAALAN